MQTVTKHVGSTSRPGRCATNKWRGQNVFSFYRKSEKQAGYVAIWVRMHDNNMQPTRLPASLSTVRKLFGGAILCDVPARFIDVRCAFFLATVVCLVWRPAEAFSFAVFFDKCRTIKKCSQTLIQIRASLSRSSSIKPSRMMAAHSKSLCSFGGWLYARKQAVR